VKGDVTPAEGSRLTALLLPVEVLLRERATLAEHDVETDRRLLFRALLCVYKLRSEIELMACDGSRPRQVSGYVRWRAGL